jgi:riboflavin biosynthesis pyrimidine reductase
VELAPLELLFEPEGLPAFDLPASIAAMYPGTFGYVRDRVVANFVSTVDGVVAIPTLSGSNKLIAAGSAADRFVMGLLRATCDTLVIGSQTMQASPKSVWSAEQAYGPAAELFAELRANAGFTGAPEIVILTRSGELDPNHPLWESGALVVTNDGGRSTIGHSLPATTDVISVGDTTSVDPTAVVDALRARGHRTILTEGGPTVFGAFVGAGLVDELFLTVSPIFAGRHPIDPRLSLIEGKLLTPPAPDEAALLGVRRHGGHLFLRYGLST